MDAQDGQALLILNAYRCSRGNVRNLASWGQHDVLHLCGSWWFLFDKIDGKIDNQKCSWENQKIHGRNRKIRYHIMPWS